MQIYPIGWSERERGHYTGPVRLYMLPSPSAPGQVTANIQIVGRNIFITALIAYCIIIYSTIPSCSVIKNVPVIRYRSF